MRHNHDLYFRSFSSSSVVIFLVVSNDLRRCLYKYIHSADRNHWFKANICVERIRTGTWLYETTTDWLTLRVTMWTYANESVCFLNNMRCVDRELFFVIPLYVLLIFPHIPQDEICGFLIPEQAIYFLEDRNHVLKIAKNSIEQI